MYTTCCLPMQCTNKVYQHSHCCFTSAHWYYHFAHHHWQGHIASIGWASEPLSFILRQSLWGEGAHTQKNTHPKTVTLTILRHVCITFLDRIYIYSIIHIYGMCVACVGMLSGATLPSGWNLGVTGEWGCKET